MRIGQKILGIVILIVVHISIFEFLKRISRSMSRCKQDRRSFSEGYHMEHQWNSTCSFFSLMYSLSGLRKKLIVLIRERIIHSTIALTI